VLEREIKGERESLCVLRNSASIVACLIVNNRYSTIFHRASSDSLVLPLELKIKIECIHTYYRLIFIPFADSVLSFKRTRINIFCEMLLIRFYNWFGSSGCSFVDDTASMIITSREPSTSNPN
jgi:hypothetical protein